MRFLVIGEFDESLPFDTRSEEYRRTVEVLGDWERRGVVERYELFNDRFGGIVILSAASHEEAEALLEQLPFVDFDTFSLQIRELVDQSGA
ncbi:MAG: hypothetical protein U0U69_00845 [Acidimicrobiia bacterium]